MTMNEIENIISKHMILTKLRAIRVECLEKKCWLKLVTPHEEAYLDDDMRKTILSLIDWRIQQIETYFTSIGVLKNDEQIQE